MRSPVKQSQTGPESSPVIQAMSAHTAANTCFRTSSCPAFAVSDSAGLGQLTIGGAAGPLQCDAGGSDAFEADLPRAGVELPRRATARRPATDPAGGDLLPGYLDQSQLCAHVPSIGWGCDSYPAEMPRTRQEGRREVTHALRSRSPTAARRTRPRTRARLPAAAACQARLDQHGWGTTGEELEIIPNRDLFVFDNVIDNPSGFQSASQQFQIHSCLAGDTRATNVPSPSCADTNLVVKGNVIWNGPQSGLRPDRTARGCFGAVGQPVERRRDQLHR